MNFHAPSDPSAMLSLQVSVPRTQPFTLHISGFDHEGRHMTLDDARRKLSQTNPERVVLFLGAGAVADAGFPLWSGLIRELAEFVQGHDERLASLMRDRLARRDLLRAADPAFEVEVPSNDRARFFMNRFDAKPELTRRHRLIGALPVAAFVTTNYDSTIERAIGFKERRVPKTFNGSDRFARFNSQFSLYRDDFNDRVGTGALVLKVHNDTSDPENLVLTSHSFKELRRLPGFEQFYASLLRSCHLLFLGFSGEDDNLLMQATALVAEYAGYGLQPSYLLLPESAAPPAAIGNTPITTVFYDPRDTHAALDSFIEDINTQWRSGGGTAELFSQPQEESAHPTVFELMSVAFSDATDQRVLDAVAEAMVANAARMASPHTSALAIVNQIGQFYRLSPLRAQELVAQYYRVPEHPPAKEELPSAYGQEAARVLSKGVRERCLVYDPKFGPAEHRLTPIVRTVIEEALQSYGCSISLALITGDRPREADLSAVVRATLARHQWDGIGDCESAALGMAFADLFMHPGADEIRILSRLAVTATSFGLIQALPAGDITRHLTPAAIYLDTTFVLPLLTRLQPRYSAYEPLVVVSKARRIPLLFQRGFLNEVSSHYRRAVSFLKNQRVDSVRDLRVLFKGALLDYENVFLVSVLAAGFAEEDKPLDVMARLFPGAPDSFSKEISKLGIGISELSNVPSEVEQVRSQIIRGKRNWYERSTEARTILAGNEATQLLELQRRSTAGEVCWFASGDAQLRRIARERDLPGAQLILPVGGAVALLQSLSSADSLGPAFARMLWSPSAQDQLDQRLAAEIGHLLENGEIDLEHPLPLEEARRMAAEMWRARAEASSIEQHDLEVDTAPELLKSAQIVGDSVMQAIGQALDAQSKRITRR